MYLDINGINIFYSASGSGPPLILLHGNGESGDIFDQIVPKLSEKYTVYTPDSRGHGKSGSGPLSYDSMAEDMAGLITCLRLEKPAFYGFSDGGIIGLILASKYPGLLSQLIVSGANASPSGLKARSRIPMRLLYAFGRSPFLGLMLHQQEITHSQLASIKIPVTVIAGQRDLIKERHTKYIADAIPSSKLIILPEENHSSYVVHSKKLLNILRTCLDADYK